MNLFNLLKKPILLFSIGMCCILLAVFLKSLDVLWLFKTPLFLLGLIIEGLAIFTFIKNKMA